MHSPTSLWRADQQEGGTRTSTSRTGRHRGPVLALPGVMMMPLVAQRSLGVLAVVVCATTASAQQLINGCPVLPADNIWNTPIDGPGIPVLSNSAAMVTTIGATKGLKADFGSGTWDGGPIGIPFITVPGTQTKYPATFTWWEESEPGPYAIPLNAPIEGGANGTGDRHAIALDTTNCLLYEMFNATPGTSKWTADSGAIFNLRSNALRPSGWTSGDAAGLPIVPGLVTYEEVLSGEIRHAIRFTVPQTRNEFVWPARHKASSLTGTQYPRMGERFRLKASFDISPFPPQVQVILRAMKKYGLIMADNGSAWYISGKPDERWNNDTLRTLGQVLGSNFEAVDATVLRIDPNSGAARQSGVGVIVSPSSATVQVGQSRAFAATVTGATGGVTWSVNGVVGGNALVGTIDATGLYLAPTVVPAPALVTVRATSISTPTASGTASVTVTAPTPTAPVISSVTPSSLQSGNFSMTINGSGFAPGATVRLDSSTLATTYLASNRLGATGVAPRGPALVTVRVANPDGTMSNTASVSVSAPAASPVSIAITPTFTRVRVGRTQQFTATVQGTTNKVVVWKVNDLAGGNSTVGTITANGLYSAPRVIPATRVVVSATSVVDTTKKATAVVSVRR